VPARTEPTSPGRQVRTKAGFSGLFIQWWQIIDGLARPKALSPLMPMRGPSATETNEHRKGLSNVKETTTATTAKPAPEALMRKIVAAFADADLRPLFDSVDDNTVWNSGSLFEGIFRFGGRYQKRIGVFDVTLEITVVYFFRRFEPIEIVSNGEVVWGLFQVEADYVPLGQPQEAGKPVNLVLAIRWVVRNGKILEHQSFFDTAGLLAQQDELS
jgi:ketosteroid isomerase-like protein